MSDLAYLNTVLPQGSYVLTTGLANRSLLCELLHDRIHPFGRVSVPFIYRQIYDYLASLQNSAYNVWLNFNDTQPSPNITMCSRSL